MRGRPAGSSHSCCSPSRALAILSVFSGSIQVATETDVEDVGTCSAETCLSGTSSQLFDWFRARGGTAEGIALQETSGKERGLVATQDLPEGAKVLTVPVGLTVTIQRSVANPLGLKLLQAASEGHAPDMKSFDGVLLAAWILHETSQADSDWKSYLSTLPTSLGTPFNFSHEGVQSCLGGLSAQSYIARGKELLAKEFELMLSLHETSGVDVTLARFLWARFMSFSRTFTVDRKRLNMDSTMNALPELPAFAKNMWNDGESTNEASVFVPVADMLNHRQNPNCDWSYSGRRGFTVTTKRPVAKGEELLISYGTKENQLWLAHYGFVEAATPGDKWNILLRLSDFLDVEAQINDTLKTVEDSSPHEVMLRIDAGNPSSPEELQELLDVCRARARALGVNDGTPRELEASALRLLGAAIAKEENIFRASEECQPICRAYRDNLQRLVATWRVFAQRALALVVGTEPPDDSWLTSQKFIRYTRLYFGLWLNGQGGLRLAKSKDDLEAAKTYGKMSFFDAVYSDD